MRVTSGCVHTDLLCEWWLVEERVARLRAFIEGRFEGSCVAAELPPPHHSWPA
jgi:hypothetical protein